MTRPGARPIVLVTGGSGFLGRHCLPLLANEFAEVHATTRGGAPHDPSSVRWHRIDLCRSPGVLELMGRIRPTHLLHLAWVTEHGSYWHSPENIRWLDASLQLVQAFEAWGGERVVTAGSCAEYDWQAGHCHETRTACAPATLYGACKHALRLVVESFRGLSAAHTRIFHLFGPGEDARRLTPAVIRPLLDGERAACTQGDQVRDLMYVKNAAAAHVKLLASDVRGSVNVASGQPMTIRTFVTAIGDLLDQSEMIDFGAIPARPDDPPVLTADIARLSEDLAFSPSYTLALALQETIRWRQCSRQTPSAVRHGTPSVPAASVACPLCESGSTSEFLRRESVPVHQNLVMRDAASARAIARGRLAMRACACCGFVFNAAFDPSLLAYGEQYDNTQTWSPAFHEYVDGLVRYLIDERGLRGKRIVEVGCGKGDFLRRMVGSLAANNTGVGFDPTYVGPDEDLQGRLRFERRFYDRSCADIPADVVIARHVIEHVPHPVALLRDIQDATINQIYLETPCLRWIFCNEVVWDLFYEHCSLFTVESLSRACEQAGVCVTGSRHVFGGQYLWLEARTRASRLTTRRRSLLSGDDVVSSQPIGDPIIAQAMAYGEAERRWVGRWQSIVAQLAEHGGVCLWGAGAKGVTFTNLVDPTGALIDCVVDLNPAKQSGFLPGTGHEIVSPDELRDRKVTTTLVLNPNYTAEIGCLLAQIAPQIAVVDLSQPRSGSLWAA